MNYPDYAVQFDDYFVGNSLYMLVTYVDSNKVAIDLTGCTFDFGLGTLTEATSGVTITGGGTAGTATISITAAAMAPITAGDHDIELAYVDGTFKKTIFKGTFTARASIL